MELDPVCFSFDISYGQASRLNMITIGFHCSDRILNLFASWCLSLDRVFDSTSLLRTEIRSHIDQELGRSLFAA